jgi:hypothetical protein
MIEIVYKGLGVIIRKMPSTKQKQFPYFDFPTPPGTTHEYIAGDVGPWARAKGSELLAAWLCGWLGRLLADS